MTVADIAIRIGMRTDNKANKKTEQDTDKAQNKIKKKSDKNSISISKSFSKIGKALVAAFAIDKIIKVTDEFRAINQQLKSVNYATEDQTALQQQVLANATETRMGYADMASATNALMQSSQKYFGTFEEASEFAELTAKFFKSGGLSAKDTLAAQTELAAAFKTNVINAGTLNKIMQASPKFADQLATKYGTTRQGLEALADSGVITATAIKAELSGAADMIESDFSAAPKTIDDAMTKVKNSIGQALAESDNTIGNLANDLADKIVPVIGEIIRGVKEFLSGAGGKIMEIIPQIIGVVSKLQKPLMEIVSTVLPTLTAVVDKLIPKIIVVVDKFLPVVIGLIESLIPPIMEIIDQLLPIVIDLINSLVPLVMTIINTVLPIIIQLIQSLLSVVMQIIQAVLPPIISLIETLLPLVMTIINMVLPIIIQLIQSLLSVVMQIIKSVLPIIISLIETLLPLVMTIINAVLPVIISLLDAIMPIISVMLTLISPILDLLTPIIELLLNILVPALDVVVKALKPLFKITEALAGVGGKVGGFLSKLFGGGKKKASVEIETDTGIVEQVAMAQGAYVTKPTNALVGEGTEPEIVSPVSKMFETVKAAIQDFFSFNAEMANGAGGKIFNLTQNIQITNTFNGTNMTEQGVKAIGQASEDITNEMAKALRYAV